MSPSCAAARSQLWLQICMHSRSALHRTGMLEPCQAIEWVSLHVAVVRKVGLIMESATRV